MMKFHLEDSKILRLMFAHALQIAQRRQEGVLATMGINQIKLHENAREGCRVPPLAVMTIITLGTIPTSAKPLVLHLHLLPPMSRI
jgi:hypothetical protein